LLGANKTITRVIIKKPSLFSQIKRMTEKLFGHQFYLDIQEVLHFGEKNPRAIRLIHLLLGSLTLFVHQYRVTPEERHTMGTLFYYWLVYYWLGFTLSYAVGDITVAEIYERYSNRYKDSPKSRRPKGDEWLWLWTQQVWNNAHADAKDPVEMPFFFRFFRPAYASITFTAAFFSILSYLFQQYEINPNETFDFSFFIATRIALFDMAIASIVKGVQLMRELTPITNITKPVIEQPLQSVPAIPKHRLHWIAQTVTSEMAAGKSFKDAAGVYPAYLLWSTIFTLLTACIADDNPNNSSLYNFIGIFACIILLEHARAAGKTVWTNFFSSRPTAPVLQQNPKENDPNDPDESSPVELLLTTNAPATK
jgi:hypothetical protein